MKITNVSGQPQKIKVFLGKTDRWATVKPGESVEVNYTRVPEGFSLAQEIQAETSKIGNTVVETKKRAKLVAPLKVVKEEPKPESEAPEVPIEQAEPESVQETEKEAPKE